MSIAVIIPIFNEEKYIEACIQSILQQTVQPDEIIAVDNNSTDGTALILQKYQMVRVVHEKKQGMIFARNAGFNAARSDIIARCDADTHIPPHWIKRITMNFQKYPIDALTGPITFYDAPIQTSLLGRAYLDLMKPMLRGKETLVGPNMALTQAMWHKVKNSVCLDDSRVHEDIDLAYHIYEAGGVVRRDDRLVVQTSSRRITKNPHSFFGEYPIRLMKTILSHDQPFNNLKRQFMLPAWYTKRRSRKQT
jgi:glycosyltransferase involved in cell wall biosynthesis